VFASWLDLSNNAGITPYQDAIMTTTVKLPSTLEDSLRERCASEGRSISEVMRDALMMYLATAPKGVASAYALGEDLFGRSYSADLGINNLASNRKAHAAQVWGEIAAQKMARPVAPNPAL
jgi:Arc/MetJ-type ribon-helix-helix transcriptional regulator